MKPPLPPKMFGFLFLLESSFPTTWSQRAVLIEAWADGEPLHLLSPHPCLAWPFHRAERGLAIIALWVETAAGVSLHPLAVPATLCTQQVLNHCLLQECGSERGHAACGHWQLDLLWAADRAPKGNGTSGLSALEGEQSPSGRHRCPRNCAQRGDPKGDCPAMSWQELGGGAGGGVC